MMLGVRMPLPMSTGNPRLPSGTPEYPMYGSAITKFRPGPKVLPTFAVLGKIDHPLAVLTLELRRARKFRSTYVEPLRAGSPILYPDGCVHTSFNTTFADTARD